VNWKVDFFRALTGIAIVFAILAAILLAVAYLGVYR